MEESPPVFERGKSSRSFIENDPEGTKDEDEETAGW